MSYFTDGSKSEDGVGSTFCVFRANLCIHTWNLHTTYVEIHKWTFAYIPKLKNYNTVFQAEAFAILQALTWHFEDFNLNLLFYLKITSQ